ncbi:MAG: hypothetical protein A2845_02190 [Candidatus Lloydbacteria bacterium RIFCSPHIGHO2_01_FULL_49_22]|uniref:Carbohydrate binding domain-containing protein n=1 Tax=Candidatus Lloydbacteria bacterium RIFCSPHIGHO2_01_FULL_49_22 TaxID=1798658 RepID=A0A1G2CWN6_9BACT|nr:MAG: hypothetical protein A2845_02190 [Candidatus Lloydbacteria bacterium RIFCSPHIGHO2_01_FULL_49_22]OGZ10262.1 MAG: hypothetical protein A3C14_01890 [Candidatus Lloydbacteria bacterium RIFCSPHIGHO2_02_FULL_50_18]
MFRTRKGRSSSRGIESLAKELTLTAQLSFDERRATIFAQRSRKTLIRTRAAYRDLLQHLNERVQATQGIELLLDNFYIIESALTELLSSWKEKMTLRVPQSQDVDGEKQPRVYTIARALTKEVDARFDRETIIEFLRSYQKNTPLSLRELDIFPDMLRFVLIEEVLRIIDASLAVLKEKADANRWYERIVDASRHKNTSARLRKLTGLLAAEYTIIPQIFGLHLLHRLDQAGKEGDIRMVSKWLKLSLSKQGVSYAQLSTLKSHTEKVQAATMRNAVTSLRYLSQVRWDKVSLELNMVDAVLSKDPVGAFAMLTDDARSLYRRTIARISDGTGTHDIEVAREAVRLARQAVEVGNDKTMRSHHVGYYLLDKGVLELEQMLGYVPTFMESVRMIVLKHNTNAYLGFICVVTLLSTGVFLAQSGAFAFSALLFFAMFMLGLLLMSEVATVFAHFMFTRILIPKQLPALDLALGIGDARRTVVVVPSMFRSAASAQKILRRMETNFVGNSDTNIFYAFLMDFRDAKSEEVPQDNKRVTEMREGIMLLNAKYPSAIPRFALFYRKRKWNTAEGTFMGWERKRGKLKEFNDLLRGKETSYIDDAQKCAAAYGTVRYVITLDEDTELVRDSARSLIGTIDHPLNRPVVDPVKMVVTEGYGIVQPRSALRFEEGGASLFSRLFGSYPGIESYSSFVSDLHQDLFGEGIFHGKGIYDIDAFNTTMSERIPENTVLSHDLLEGLYARVGIASSAHIFEGFPSNYREYIQRSHRWIRGDWQIITWLFDRGAVFSRIGRYRIFDNLRRSLIPIAAVLAVIFSLFSAAELSSWSIVALLAIGSGQLISAVLRITERTTNWKRPVSIVARFESMITSSVVALVKTLFLGAFALHSAMITIDAIVRSMWRLFFSKRHLLEWQTAYEAALERKDSIKGFIRFMWRSVCLSLALVYLLFHGGGIQDPVVVMWVLAWLFAPYCAARISAELKNRYVLSDTERLYLRKVAARTYWFFIDLATKEDSWLVPDHLQEEPPSKRHSHGLGISPTNLGMYLLSLSGGRALGLSSLSAYTDRITRAFASMERMVRYNGHFYNWYELKQLTPLAPRYVSSVDSANLALSLLAVKGALIDATDAPIISDAMFQGLDAQLHVLLESCEQAITIKTSERHERKLLGEIRSAATESIMLIQKVANEALTPRGSDLVWTGVIHHAVRTRNALEELRLEGKSERFEEIFLAARHIESVADAYRDNVARYLGHAVISAVSALAHDPKLHALYLQLSLLLQRIPSVNDLADGVVRREIESVGILDAVLLSQLETEEKKRVRAWYAQILERLAESEKRASEAQSSLIGSAKSAAAYVEEMNFEFLYNKERGLFHIGYNCSTEKLDEAFYDLLASEANSTSIIGIAKRDVPQAHWAYLGRKLIQSGNGDVLVASWAGSLFEYLGTLLYFNVPRESFWGVSAQRAIAAHQAFAQKYHIPWGMGESASSRQDVARNYHYQAFGEPSLGFKRDLSESIVVAPYTSALALSMAPKEALANFQQLERAGAFGRYGFYDAIDFTKKRAKEYRESSGVPARIYYAHHQGFILSSIINVLNDGWVRTMVAKDPQMEVSTQLFEEKMPEDVRGEKISPIVPEIPVAQTVSTFAASPRRYLPWRTKEATSMFLSNEDYFTRITATGAGESSIGDVLITRASSDMLRESVGTFFYVFDAARDKMWSPTYMPTRVAGDKHTVSFGEQIIQFKKTHEEIDSSLIVTPLIQDHGELRELSLTNTREKETVLTFGVCAELSLSRRQDESSHPNYEQLFVSTETHWGGRAIIASRPDPHDRNHHIVAGFLLVGDGMLDDVHAIREKSLFLGSPEQKDDPPILRDLSRANKEGPAHTLDSVAAFVGRVRLRPKATTRVTLVTIVGKSKEEVFARLKIYRNYKSVLGVIGGADRAGGQLLSELSITALQAEAYGTLASIAIAREVKSGKESNSNARPWVSALWKMSISGSRPIILCPVTGATDIPMVRQLLSCHSYFVKKGIVVDLVIFNEHSGGYLKTFEDEIDFLLNMHHAQNGNTLSTVFHVHAEQLSDLEQDAVMSAASVCIDTKKGSIVDATVSLRRSATRKYPQKLSIRSKRTESIPTQPQQGNTNALQFFNGIGGYDEAKKEYVVFRTKETRPVRPWSHIVANAHVGFLATDRGTSFTWSRNSYDNKLTIPYNDPLSAHTGEAIYLRDEDTGAWISPFPVVNKEALDCEVRFGEGYCTYITHAPGITINMTMYVGVDESVKYYRVEMTNTSKRQKSFALFGYFELLMGSLERETKKHLSFRVTPENILVATQNYRHQFLDSRIFVGIVGGADEFTVSREEFLGRYGMISAPAALTRKGLSSEIHGDEESATALKKDITIAPGEQKVEVFFLGETDEEKLPNLLQRLQDSSHSEQAFTMTKQKWNALPLPKFTLPDATLSALANQFLPYQTLSSRIYARLGFYQIGGAIGFRDQLQDALSILWYDPSWVREHILVSAAHQFREGDVLSWWQPHNNFGARTRLSDPHLWLPHVTLRYVRFTGDEAILDEMVPYLSGEIPDKADRPNVVGIFESSNEATTLYEHLIRAVERSLTAGVHGLPLMCAADWNDGMNRVGSEGEGESVWLAWFLVSVLDEMSLLTEKRGDPSRAERYRAHSRGYRDALKKFGWGGKWYRRAYTDSGAMVGASSAKESRLDSITQSWAYFADGDTKESREALRSAKQELSIHDGHVPLFWPPSSRAVLDLGTVSDYPPGVRENAAQYNHAALWLAQALFASGDPDAGMMVVDAVNPFKRSETKEKALVYQGEPYVVAAEVYSSPTYPGQAGWTWYTASAGVLYRTILEYMLGVKHEGNTLTFSPSFPTSWHNASLALPYGGSLYSITFEVKGRDAPKEVLVDGIHVKNNAVTLVDDKTAHKVHVSFGRTSGKDSSS